MDSILILTLYSIFSICMFAISLDDDASLAQLQFQIGAAAAAADGDDVPQIAANAPTKRQLQWRAAQQARRDRVAQAKACSVPGSAAATAVKVVASSSSPSGKSAAKKAKVVASSEMPSGESGAATKATVVASSSSSSTGCSAAGTSGVAASLAAAADARHDAAAKI